MARLLITLLAALTLLAPAYAGGAARSLAMNSGEAECGCCCETEVSAPASEIEARADAGCGCSLPPSVPPTAPFQAPVSSAQDSLSALDLQHAPVAEVLPLPVVSDRDGIADESPALDTCCRERLGVWLL